MILFSLIFALLLERWHSSGHRNGPVAAFLSYADTLGRYFNTGIRHHGIAAWFAAVLPVLVVASWAYHFLYGLSPILACAWNVAILYFTMGFRQFSESFVEVKAALKNGDVLLARQLLKDLGGSAKETDELSSQQIARVAIEMGLLYSHRYLFAIIVSFVILPGPMGPLLYRMAELLNERWGGQPEAPGAFAAKAFEIIDWLPARCTAMSFAIAGNFEDAVYCWRAQAASWMNQNQGIILASGAGALGVRLGDPLRQPHGEFYRPELGVGEEADVDFLQNTIGLVWRALVVWLLLLLLLEIASWAG